MKRALVFIIILLACTILEAQQKYALIIGNSAYTGITRLSNPVNDANDMEAALSNLGFSVEKVINGSLDQMETAVMNFQRKLSASRDAYGFFFYAGHGVQSNGENYLIPVDANNILSENHLRQRAVSVQTILDNLTDAGNELNMIVLDACRDNPFGWSRGGNRGLTVVSRAPTGSIIMYATSANSTADDGTGRNGLFTDQLLNSLRTPGLTVRDVFDKTGAEVVRITNGKQHPEISVRYFGTAYFDSASDSPRPSAAVQPAPAPAPPPAAPAQQPVQPSPLPGGSYFTRSHKVGAGFLNLVYGVGSFTMGDWAGGLIVGGIELTGTILFWSGAFVMGMAIEPAGYSENSPEWQDYDTKLLGGALLVVFGSLATLTGNVIGFIRPFS